MGMRDKNAKPTELGKRKGIGCNLYTGTQPRSAQGMETYADKLILRHPRDTQTNIGDQS